MEAAISPFALLKKVAGQSPVQPDEFFWFIGRITFTHAGIEQDIKGVLIEDWDMPENKVNGLYGFQLRTFFLESIKALNISEKYYMAYKAIIDRFWEASGKRNDLIKAAYGLTKQNRSVFKYDFKLRGKYSPEMNYDEWKKKGTRIITSEELKSLIKELDQIREDYFQLSRHVFLERKQVKI